MENASDVMKQLETDCRQNSLSLALLYMQKALLLSDGYSACELSKNCIEVLYDLRLMCAQTVIDRLMLAHRTEQKSKN